MLEKTVAILPKLFPRGVTLSNPTSLGFGSFIRKRDGSLDEPSSSYSAKKQMSPAYVAQASLEEEGGGGHCLQSLCPMPGTVPVRFSAGS